MSTRVAIINKEKCKPDRCNHECKLMCPINSAGKKCIEIEDIKPPAKQVAKINEGLCIGCGICVQRCPFAAIQVVNLPTENKVFMLHSYGTNSFRIYKLPIPQIGKVYGFIGKNGVGKSTLMNILSGKLVPNGGVLNHNPLTDKKSVLSKEIAGTELQKYFGNLTKMRIKIKPQNIKAVKKSIIDKYGLHVTCATLIESLHKTDQQWYTHVMEALDFENIISSEVGNLSGGELQRFVTGMILMQDADVYIFDEFSNYLDVDQRLRVAELIQKLKRHDRYIFLVEHDMSILDYTSDIVSILYGVPSAYGIVSLPYTTAESINMYFGGYIAAENMRFRNTAFGFKENLTMLYTEDNMVDSGFHYMFDATSIKLGDFQLDIKDGSIGGSTYLVMLMGPNGCGKTTYLNHLCKSSGYIMSFKKQYNEDLLELDDTVIGYLYKHISKAMADAIFMSDVIKSLDIPDIYDCKISKLSGGEMQRLGIALCLGTPADMYLLDEPSANLDIEYRVMATKVIKRFLIHNKKLGFIVEHDIMMSISMGLELMSKIVVFSREGNHSHASKPTDFSVGINDFLESMDITFRSDMKYKRPRINQANSQKDREQKSSGKYYQ